MSVKLNLPCGETYHFKSMKKLYKWADMFIREKIYNNTNCNKKEIALSVKSFINKYMEVLK